MKLYMNVVLFLNREPPVPDKILTLQTKIRRGACIVHIALGIVGKALDVLIMVAVAVHAQKVSHFMQSYISQEMVPALPRAV